MFPANRLILALAALSAPGAMLPVGARLGLGSDTVHSVTIRTMSGDTETAEHADSVSVGELRDVARTRLFMAGREDALPGLFMAGREDALPGHLTVGDLVREADEEDGPLNLFALPAETIRVESNGRQAVYGYPTFRKLDGDEDKELYIDEHLLVHDWNKEYEKSVYDNSDDEQEGDHFNAKYWKDYYWGKRVTHVNGKEVHSWKDFGHHWCSVEAIELTLEQADVRGLQAVKYDWLGERRTACGEERYHLGDHLEWTIERMVRQGGASHDQIVENLHRHVGPSNIPHDYPIKYSGSRGLSSLPPFRYYMGETTKWM